MAVLVVMSCSLCPPDLYHRPELLLLLLLLPISSLVAFSTKTLSRLRSVLSLSLTPTSSFSPVFSAPHVFILILFLLSILETREEIKNPGGPSTHMKCRLIISWRGGKKERVGLVCQMTNERCNRVKWSMEND